LIALHFTAYRIEAERFTDAQVDLKEPGADAVIAGDDGLAGFGIRVECAEACNDHAGLREVGSESGTVEKDSVSVRVTPGRNIKTVFRSSPD
jgi:hypothetical protein